jgi:hypothetical protein
MSTLQEIEAAAKKLSRFEQEQLIAVLEEQIDRSSAATTDSFEQVIGSVAGPAEATGRNAEEILYGPGA